MQKIKKGYVLKPRIMYDSEIAHSTPCVREVYDYLVSHAVYKKYDKNGLKLERGQLLITYDEIREKLSWKRGYRMAFYSKMQIRTSMNILMKTPTKTPAINATKTAKGTLITINSYNILQNSKNYEERNEEHNEERNEERCEHTDLYNKKDLKKEKKNLKEKNTKKRSTIKYSQECHAIKNHLVEIVEEGTNSKVVEKSDWLKSIQRLHDEDKITWDRMEKTLCLYSEYFNEQYIPEVFTGNSFKTKFIRLEKKLKELNLKSKPWDY